MMTTDIRHPRDAVMNDGLTALYAYWDRLRGDSFAPSWRRWDWANVPSRVIPWMAVVDVKRNPYDFIYRFWGTARTTLQGRDFTGQSVRNFGQPDIANKAWAEYVLVSEKKVPIHITTKGVAAASGEAVIYDFIRLPFSDDGVDVHQIIGGGVYEDHQIKALTNFYGTEDDV